MKNEHLVPPAVLDLIARLSTADQNEKANITQRLLVTHEAIEKALNISKILLKPTRITR